MIRPSALQVAEDCGYSSVLAERFNPASEASETGDEIHRQIAAALTQGTTPLDAGARAAVEAIREEYEVLGVEIPLKLYDPETGDLVTEGTADVLARTKSDGILTIIDHKTGRPENVTEAEDNLQFHAYGLAAALQSDAQEYGVVASHVVDGKFWWGKRHCVAGNAMWGYLERIKLAAAKDPRPVVGTHCQRCFQQKRCEAFILPAHAGPSALEPFTKPDGLTRDNALRALVVVDAMEAALKVARERLKNHVREFGPIEAGDKRWGPVWANGRRSGPTVEECESAGVGHLVKQGQRYEKFQWSRAK